MAKAKSSAKKTEGKLIDALNEVKQAELTAITQFAAQANILRDMGLDKLAEKFKEEAIEEFSHDEKLAERILFLGGTPKITPLVDPVAPRDIKGILRADIAMEKGQIDRIKKTVTIAYAENDPGTVHILTEILLDEEHHWAMLSQWLDQLEQFGAGYLACVCGGGVPMAGSSSPLQAQM